MEFQLKYTPRIIAKRLGGPAGPARLNAIVCASALLALGSAAQAQSIVANFAGLNLAQTGPANGFRYAPPDSNGAIGKDHFVEFINGGYSVFDRSGGQQSFTTDSTFWLNAGASSSLVNEGLSDTRVKYDATSGRWFASEITLGNASTLNNSVLVAVSKTSNPLDGWTSTSYNVAGSTLFNDYPTLSVDANAIYIGTNNFGASGFESVTLSSIPKSSLLGAAPSTSGIATFTQGLSSGPAMGFTPQAVTNSGTGYTGSSIVSISATAFNEVNITKINNTAGAGATLGATTVTYIAYDGNPTLARQPGGSRVVDGLDDRFSGTIYQVGNIIYAANAINVDNAGGGLAAGFNKVHWIMLDATTGALLQEGLIGDASHDYWQPSIAANEKGDVVIGFNKSGADLNISAVAAVGHTVNGVLSFADEVLLKTSSVGNYTDGFGNPSSRWGDYSATMLDPTNSNVFWTVQEVAYGSTTWGTQISAIDVTAVPEPETYALMLAGLGVIGWASCRRREGTTA